MNRPMPKNVYAEGPNEEFLNHNSSGPWKSLYLVHFEKALTEVLQKRQDYTTLFTRDEKEFALPLISTEENSISSAARGLYTRLFQRKGPWFRFESIVAYEELLNHWQEQICPREQIDRAQRALLELEHAGFVSGIKAGPTEKYDEKTLLEAIEACARMEELRALLKIFCRKLGGGNMPRHQALRELRRNLRGQRTLVSFFSNSSSNFGDCAGSAPLHAELCRLFAPGAPAGRFVLVRRADAPTRLFRRVLRLLLHLTSGGRGGGVSVTEPVFNPALLQDFGRAKFADYECWTTRRAFEDRRRFVQWEAVQELRRALDTSRAAGGADVDAISFGLGEDSPTTHPPQTQAAPTPLPAQPQSTITTIASAANAAVHADAAPPPTRRRGRPAQSAAAGSRRHLHPSRWNRLRGVSDAGGVGRVGTPPSQVLAALGAIVVLDDSDDPPPPPSLNAAVEVKAAGSDRVPRTSSGAGRRSRQSSLRAASCDGGSSFVVGNFGGGGGGSAGGSRADAIAVVDSDPEPARNGTAATAGGGGIPGCGIGSSGADDGGDRTLKASPCGSPVNPSTAVTPTAAVGWRWTLRADLVRDTLEAFLPPHTVIDAAAAIASAYINNGVYRSGSGEGEACTRMAEVLMSAAGLGPGFAAVADREVLGGDAAAALEAALLAAACIRTYLLEVPPTAAAAATAACLTAEIISGGTLNQGGGGNKGIDNSEEDGTPARKDSYWLANKRMNGQPTPNAASAAAAIVVEDVGSAAAQAKELQNGEEMLPLDPGWGLCSVAWHGVAHLERCRRYEEAVSMLQLILSTRFLAPSRGGMYNRLVLDLQHLGDHAAALEACRAGLRDRNVGGGDRMALQRRRDRLLGTSKHAANSVRPSDASPTCALPNACSPVTSLVGGSGSFESPLCPPRGGAVAQGGLDCLGAATSAFAAEEGDEMMGDLCGLADLLGELSGPLASGGSDVGGNGNLGYKVETMRGMRLGHRLPGRKSHFASFDPEVSPTDSTAAALAAVIHVPGCDGAADAWGDKGPWDQGSWLGGRGGEAVCGVEELALQHYARMEAGGWRGWHCEGACLVTLFGLLLWDIIFAPVPDVFLTPFQDGPLDLASPPRFYLSRRAAADSALAALAAAQPRELAAAVAFAWRARRGTMCRGVRWDRWTLRGLQAAACGLGGRGLSAVFRALCIDFRHLSAGMPDLLLLKIRARPRRLAANAIHAAVGCDLKISMHDTQEDRALCITPETATVLNVSMDFVEGAPGTSTTTKKDNKDKSVRTLNGQRIAREPNSSAEALNADVEDVNQSDHGGWLELDVTALVGNLKPSRTSVEAAISMREHQDDANEAKGATHIVRELADELSESRHRRAAARRWRKRKADSTRSLARWGSSRSKCESDEDPDQQVEAVGPSTPSVEKALAEAEMSSELNIDWEAWEFDFQCRLVEVKGPRDRLMDRQAFWLAVLGRAGIDVTVCRVTEDSLSEGDDDDDSPKTRRVKEDSKPELSVKPELHERIRARDCLRPSSRRRRASELLPVVAAPNALDSAFANRNCRPCVRPTTMVKTKLPAVGMKEDEVQVGSPEHGAHELLAALPIPITPSTTRLRGVDQNSARELLASSNRHFTGSASTPNTLRKPWCCEVVSRGKCRRGAGGSAGGSAGGDREGESSDWE